MDLITHFIVPYAILTFLRSKNRLAGAFGGISLDFDVLIVWVGILFPELFIFSHRGITHSFIFGFLTSVLFLYVITRKPVKEYVGKIIRRDLPITFNRASVMAVFFGALTHLFLDALTSKGIPLLYPLTINRFSAELFYYMDIVTMVVASLVLLILYLRLNLQYKKLALISFIILLIVFGGIRAYEKGEVIQKAEIFDGNYTQISAYPSSDIFTWSVVEKNSNNTRYEVFNFNNFDNSISNIKTYKSFSVNNGSYDSAIKAVNTANSFPEVQNFKWDAYYTIIRAEGSSGWNITYFDIVNSHYGIGNNLTVHV